MGVDKTVVERSRQINTEQEEKQKCSQVMREEERRRDRSAYSVTAYNHLFLLQESRSRQRVRGCVCLRGQIYEKEKKTSKCFSTVS